jgi:hypothetical protein
MTTSLIEAGKRELAFVLLHQGLEALQRDNQALRAAALVGQRVVVELV